MKNMTIRMIAIRPASRLWRRNASPRVGLTRGVRELRDRERQLAELEDRDQVLGLGQRVAADAALADLDLAAGDRLVDHRGADHLAVEDDREELAHVVPGEVREQLLPLRLEGEVDRAPARLSAPMLAAAIWSPENSGGNWVRSTSWPADMLRRRPSGTKSRRPVVPDEVPDLVRVLDTRHLDDDPVRSLGDHLGLGHTGCVDPVPDDLLHDVEVGLGGDLALGREHLVLDPQTAAQVETQLGLEGAALRPSPGTGRGTATTLSTRASRPMTTIRIGPARRIGAG